MQQFGQEIKRLLAHMAAGSLAVCCLAYFAGYAGWIPGLVAGAVTSLLYLVLMSYRIKRSMQLPLPKAINYMRQGWLIRLTFITAMLMISLRLRYIHFPAAVAGLFLFQIVLYINAVIIVAKGMVKPE